MKTFDKDPDALLDYEWDWSDWLSTDAISQTEFETTEELNVDESSVSGGKVIAWISGGNENSTGVVRCKIITAEGREDIRSAIFNIKSR